MSLGYVGYARLAVEDDEYVVYEYSGENWNDENSASGDALLFDGEIQIKKASFEEPEIHEKLKKMPNHRKKLVTKRITHVVDVSRKIQDGDIVILKECKNEFYRFSNSGVKYIALRLLYHIYEEYQETGKIPERTGFMQ